MKKFNLLTKIFVLFLSANSFAQGGLQGIVVEKYYKANSTDVANATSNNAIVPLTTNSVTYRVYADLAAGYKFNMLVGSASNPLNVSTTTAFYNDPSYGVSVNMGTQSEANVRKNTTMLDSYFTTGGAGGGLAGVLKTDDSNGALTHTNGLLTNNPGGCFGLPIQGSGAMDGLVPSSVSTYIAPNVVGISATQLQALDQTSGNTVLINGGSIAALGGVVGPTTNNLVFIGQFTTDGIFTFALNIQIQPVGGAANTAENYYANATNLPSGGLTHPSLTLAANSLPTVSLAANPSTSGIITGTSMTLTATAADANGTVDALEFFVDGVSLGAPAAPATGTTASGTWTKTYVAVVGTHQITVKATDNDCASTTTSNYTINVAANTAPTATLTAAATGSYSIAGSAPNYGNVYQGATLTLSSAATDTDGSVTSVEFYTNATGAFVLIGSTTPATYTGQTTAAQTQAYTVPASYSGTLTLRVRAKDNLNLFGNYQTITMNVVPNPAPVCTLTAPTSSTSVSAPNAVTLSATATDDANGSVASVSFYVDGTILGSPITSSPYTTTWTPSTAGLHTFEARATDNIGAIGYSSIVSIDVVDPNAPPYKVGDITQYCDQNTYLIPIKAMLTNNVQNVIGYDIVVNYDATELTATNDVIMNTAALGLINPAYVDANSQVMPVNGTVGTINISLSLKANAPANTFFSGNDKDLCFVKFNRNGLGAVETTPISIASLNESYYTQVLPKGTAAGSAISIKNNTYVGDLKFWFDNQAMPYTQGTNLITEVNGSIVINGATAASGSNQLTIPTTVANVVAGMKVVANGVNHGTTVTSITSGNVITLSAVTTAQIQASQNITFVSANTVTPNASGSFTHSLLNGQKIRISRDISPNQTVQGVINAADAVIAKTVVLSGNYIPSIYQMLAMDVNLDGKVSAGDVSQMKQRTTSAYGEFRQAWNYDNQGNNINLQPSKDWVFVDQTTLNTAAYQISATFPANDGVGFSKTQVPVVDFNLNANVLDYANCPIVELETYKGIMLGDANGSYASLTASTGLKSENGAVVLDLTSAVKEGNTFRIPVSFESTESTNALDFAVRFNENNVSFAELNEVAVGMEASSFMNEADRTLRFTGFDVANFTVGTTVAELVLQSNNETISEKDIIADLALINGKPVDVKFEKSSEAIQSVFNVSIYPNPSNGAFSVQATENAIVDVYDMNGKQITASQVISSNGKVNIDLNNVEAGVYLVRVQNETFSTTKRIVIEK